MPFGDGAEGGAAKTPRARRPAGQADIVAASDNARMFSGPNPREHRDVFISHASEDKQSVARPLTEELVLRGYTVWYDEYELVWGDPLQRRIDEGLAESTIGVVVLSHAFFAKPWPQRELEGLTARMLGGERNVIVPIWHQLCEADLLRYSPPLAGLLAGNSTEGIKKLVDGIERVLDRRAVCAREPATENNASAARPVMTLDRAPAEAGAPSGRVRKCCGSSGERQGLRLVARDLVDDGVELGAGEGPFEWPGERAVVLGEVQQVPGEFG
jgi:hypothetical protein